MEALKLRISKNVYAMISLTLKDELKITIRNLCTTFQGGIRKQSMTIAVGSVSSWMVRVV